jgi:hypothetical protein
MGRGQRAGGRGQGAEGRGQGAEELDRDFSLDCGSAVQSAVPEIVAATPRHKSVCAGSCTCITALCWQDVQIYLQKELSVDAQQESWP